MSDPKNQEPSMEEILASIRRIIAEDAEAAPPQAEAAPDVPATPEPVPPPPPPPRPTPPPPAPIMEEPVEDDDILELTNIVADEPIEPPPPPPPPYRAPEPQPVRWEEPEPPRRDYERERLVSESTAAVSSATMASLAQQLGRSRKADVYLSDRAVTLEEITKEVLKPMLQGWLDEHLPGLVERLVREEIQRIARDAL